MLEPLMHRLATQRIVLASGSPRRKLILENIGLKFEVVPSTFEENLRKEDFEFPFDYVKETAKGKALEVAKRLAKDARPPDLIIGSDTVVTMDNKIYEKPVDKEHAFQMISSYMGRSHTVYTGVVMLTPKKGNWDDFNITSFHAGTDVTFAEVDSDTIRKYIDTGEPMDKAGGYGIQAAGGTLISGINGDYFNVMGFPLHLFAKHLVQIYTS
ncbi:hypothetical protein CAPTEDRAFT_117136 [Capitella teleta]|uniref:Uncharacterized protein n=1 Tax=Capitella teleta TaxID=283909 RepID=R7UM23_CAPTE|nr:hypothetical protein CAPTEDRAFT_117136 [Capitella teleta]|eukprot:ELU04327.1 hypothetical protein CAPTEDRAFT_117136 [Capitella teleta]